MSRPELAALAFGGEMDFVLNYRGPLPAHKKCAPEKNAIRRWLHYQLFNLCQEQPLLSGVFDPEIRTARLVGRCINVDHLRNHSTVVPGGTLGNQPLFFKVLVGGYYFVPLVTRVHELVCEIDIRWMRRERAGSLVQDGGDLDNRLKNLFDALRMPHSADEVRGFPKKSDGKWFLCLLEDDSLITKLSVSTHRIWEPLPPGAPETDVRIDLHVTVKSTLLMMANLGFPSSSI